MDFAQWAVVGHKDDTGLGRQLKDLKKVLGIQGHLIIPSERLFDYPPSGPDEQILLPADDAETVREKLQGVKGVIFPERHSWNPHLLPVCRELNVVSVCEPNWEWFRGVDAHWKLCDFFVCHSKWTATILASYGFHNYAVIPPAPDISSFPARHITGPARKFIHCAGLVDGDDRKGTRDTIEAFKRVRRDDITLTVRMQKPADLPKLDERITVKVGNLADPATLYGSGDVAIQPSKMEGIGFMVLEPFMTGLPVITLDYPPMNEYVITPELLVRKRWFKRKAFSSQWVKHAHLRLPDIGDLAAKIKWCCENDLSRISAANRARAEQMFDVQMQRDAWSAALAPLLKAKAGAR